MPAKIEILKVTTRCWLILHGHGNTRPTHHQCITNATFKMLQRAAWEMGEPQHWHLAITASLIGLTSAMAASSWLSELCKNLDMHVLDPSEPLEVRNNILDCCIGLWATLVLLDRTVWSAHGLCSLQTGVLMQVAA